MKGVNKVIKNDNVIQASGYFDGNSLKGNFDVQLRFKFFEENLANALQFVAGIGKRISLIAIVEENKKKLGIFTVYNMKIDKNAVCTVTFKSSASDSFIDEFSCLMIEGAKIILKAKVLED